MSRTIDERVVEMKFNNKDFEKNASATMSTLEKLKQKLRLDGATKGIDEINKAAGKFSLDGMGSATDRVAVKFDAMSMAAMAAIQRIVDKAMNAGEKLVKSLSVDQIQAGWDKFSKKTTSVGTMIAQGYSQAEVNRELDRLLWFTDETSYDFSAMVDSISKFTASGQSLGDSVDALEGIALWAAKSGQNASTASRAMYQLAQAIPRAMTRQDWISVMNANMDTEEFRKTAIQAALEIGTLKEVQAGIYRSVVNPGADAFDVSGFIDSLTDGRWLTSEVQMATYNKYAAAVNDIYDYTQEHGVLAAEAIRALAGETDEFSRQAFKAGQETRTLTDAIDATKDAVSSGWMKTFEYLIGDYTQATAFWSDVVEKLYDVFAMPGESRNKTLYESMVSGFRQFADEQAISTDFLIEGIRKEFLKGNEGMTDSFNKMIDMHGFDDSLKFGWLNADLLAKGIHNVVENFEELKATTPEVEFTDDILKQMDAYQALDEAVQNNTIDLKDYMKTINRLSGRSNLLEGLQNVWESLFGVIKDEEGNVVGAIGIIQTLKDAIADVFPPITADRIYAFTERFKEFTKSLQLSEDQAKGLKNIIRGLLQPFKWVWNLVKNIAGRVGKLFGALNEGFKGFLERFADLNTFEDVVKRIFGEDRFLRLSEAWKTISKNFTEAWDKIKKAFTRVDKTGEKVNVLRKAWEKIKEVLTPVANWILDKIVKGMEEIAKINWDKIADGVIEAIGSIKDFVKSLPNAFKSIYEAVKTFFENLGNEGFVQSIKDFWQTLKDIFSKPGEYINWVGEDSPYAQAVGTISGLFSNSTGILEKFWEVLKEVLKQLTPGKIALIAFGVVAFKLLLSLNKLIDGAAGVTSSISGFFNTLTKRIKPSPIAKIALAIVALAASLTLLSMTRIENLKAATTALMEMSGVFAILLVVTGLVTKMVGNKDKMFENSIGKMSTMVLAMSAALAILSGALFILSQTDMTDMGNKLGYLATVVMAWMAVSIILSKIGNGPDKGVMGMLAVAGSMLLVAWALERLAAFNYDQMAAALDQLKVVMGTLIGLAVVMRMMGANRFSSAMGVTGMVLNLLFTAKVLKKLADEPFDKLLQGILGFIPIFLAFELLAIVMRTASGKNETMKWADGAKKTTKSQNPALAMIGMAASLYLVAIAIKKLGEIPTGELLKGGLVALAIYTVYGLMIRFALYSEKETTKTRGNVLKAGVSMLMLSAGMIIIALAIQEVGKINTDTLIKGTAAIGVLMFAMGFLMKSVNNISASMLGGLIVAMIMLGEIGALLVLMSLWPDTTGLIVAMAAVSAILLSLGVMMKMIASVMKDAGELDILGNRKNKLTQVIGVMAVALGALVVIGWILQDLGNSLGNVNWKTMIAFSVGVGVLSLALAATMLILSKIKIPDGGKDIKTVMMAFGLLIVGAALLVAAVSIAIESIPNAQEAVAKGITVLASMWQLWPMLLEFAMLMAALTGIAGLVKLMHADTLDIAFIEVMFGLLIMIVAGIAAGVAGINEAGQGDSVAGIVERGIVVLKQFSQLGPMLLEMAAVMIVITVLGALISAVPMAMLTTLVIEVLFGAFIMMIVGIAYVLGEIEKAGGAESIIYGLGMLGKIGTAIGEFFGGLVGGLISGFLDALLGVLPVFAVALTNFMVLLLPAIAIFNSIHLNEDTVQSLKNIAEAILIFAVADFIDKLGPLFNSRNSLEAAGKKIVAFAPYLAQFAEKMSGHSFKSDDLKNAAEAAKMLAEFVNLVPREGGLINAIIGNTGDMSKFAAGVEAMVDALIVVDQKLYNYSQENHNALNQENVDKVKNMATMFTDLANVIPRTGGILQDILGESDMKDFGTKMEAFIDSAIKVDNKIIGHIMRDNGAWNEETTKRVTNIGTMFAELEKAIPKQNGWAQKILGEQNLATFGQRIGDFADAAILFDDTLAGHDWSGAKARALVIKTIGMMMAELNAALPEERGDFIAFFAGEKMNMSDFGEGLKDLGYGIAAFDTAVKDIGDATRMQQAAKGLEYLVGAWTSIEGEFATGEELAASGERNVFKIGWAAIVDAWSDTTSGSKIVAIQHMAEGMVAFAQALVPFFEITDGMPYHRFLVVAEGVQAIVNAFNIVDSLEAMDFDRVLDAITVVANAQIDGYIDSIKARKSDVGDAAKEVFDIIPETIASTESKLKMQTAGDESMKAFIAPFTSGEGAENLKAGLQDIVNKAGSMQLPGLNVDMNMVSQLMPQITSGATQGGTTFMNTMASTMENVGLVDENGNDPLEGTMSYVQSYLSDGGSWSGVEDALGSAMDNLFSTGEGSQMGDLANMFGIDFANTGLTSMTTEFSSEETQEKATEMVSTFSDFLKLSADEKMPQTGEYAVDGFCKGIVSSKSHLALKGAATTMATRFSKATDLELRISSPSKVFEEKGEYTVLGYVKGVLGSMYLAKEAAEDLGTNTVDAMAAAVSYAYAAAISDYDFRPTISPILDLEDVRAEAASMRDMFDFMPAIKMAAETGDAVEAKVAQVKFDKAALNDSITGLRNDISRIKVRVADTPTSQPDLEGAIERGFSKVSVNMDGRKVGKMNVNYQNRQTNLRGKTQVK